MSKSKITVSATIAADTSKVWDCWTLPEHIIHWNFASDDWHCPRASNDLRAGGKFNYNMSSKDGKNSFDFEGVYDEVIEHKKIAYSLGDGRQITVIFENDGNGTKITETFDPEELNSEELQKYGWQAILNNFKKYAEGQ